MTALVSQISIAVLAALVAPLLIWVITRLYIGWKVWPGFKAIFRMTQEFTKAGGVNFFASRKSYIRFKDHGTASDYINRASSSVIYVGFWLAHGTEVGNITHTLKDILESGKKVTIVLMNPDSNVIIPCSRFLGTDEEEVRNRIQIAKKKFCELYSDLSADAKERFSIKFHEIPISASAFLLDHERDSGGRTLLDFKLYSFSRDDSFGIEFRQKGRPLYDSITKSYLEIVKDAKNYDCKGTQGDK